MTVGRLIGWFFLIAAIFLGSADAVLALGPGGDAEGIDTGHLLTLLAGYRPPAVTPDSLADFLVRLACESPAWSAFFALGTVMLVLSRPRQRCRHRRRRYRVRTAEAAS